MESWLQVIVLRQDILIVMILLCIPAQHIRILWVGVVVPLVTTLQDCTSSKFTIIVKRLERNLLEYIKEEVDWGNLVAPIRFITYLSHSYDYNSRYIVYLCTGLQAHSV